MKIYLAPLEGITGYTYRRALHQCFGGFDKYFIPFILPNQKGQRKRCRNMVTMK